MEKEEALTTPFGLAGGFLLSWVSTVWVPLGRGELVPLTGRAPNLGSLETMEDLLRTFCSISKQQSWMNTKETPKEKREGQTEKNKYLVKISYQLHLSLLNPKYLLTQ